MLPSEYLEKGWTREGDTKDCNGTSVAYDSSDAVAWCMLDAIKAYAGVSDIYKSKNAMLLYEQIRKIIRGPERDYENAPNRTQQDVIAVMKQAEQELRWYIY